MSPFVQLVILSLLGFLIGIYLIWERKRGGRPACIIGTKCHVVLESKYNKLFGLHNDLAGAMFYASVLFLIILLHYDLGPVDIWLGLLRLNVFVGSVVAGMLMVLQWRVLKAWCFWCIVSNVNTWLITLIVLASSN